MDTAEEDQDPLLDYEDYGDENPATAEAMDEDGDDGPQNPMAALLASARSRADQYSQSRTRNHVDQGDDSADSDVSAPSVTDPTSSTNALSSLNHSSAGPSSRRAQDKTIASLISASDVLLYVLDARDPISSRSVSTEQDILSHHPDKRILLILNKADLVPAPVLNSWLATLRRSLPTIPFRSANASTSTGPKTPTPHQSALSLFNALKTFAARTSPAKKSKPGAITAGILGYPNTGKSTLINTLLSLHTAKSSKSRGACPVGASAGVTTALRRVKLDAQLSLLDSPGVIFPSAAADNVSKGKSRASREEEHANLVLLDAVPAREIADPLPAVSLLLARLAASPDLLDRLKQHYNIPSLPAPEHGKPDVNPLLIHVARARGRLGRGGVPNLRAAGMAVLCDWRDGRIGGWVAPQGGAGQAGWGGGDWKRGGDTKEVVRQWAEEFKLDGLWGGEGVVEDGGEDVAMSS